MQYQDSVVSRTLQMTRASGAPSQYRAWMYLSDHGQEVGHSSDRVGHSPMTESGYRIPTVVWRSEKDPHHESQVVQRPFRADWMAWTLVDLLDLQWAGQQDSRNVLSKAYQWEPPTLPLTVKSFVE